MDQSTHLTTNLYHGQQGQCGLPSLTNQTELGEDPLGTDSWRLVRRGIQVMAASTTVAALLSLLLLLCLLFLPLGARHLVSVLLGCMLLCLGGYLGGLAMSLTAPGHARLGWLKWLTGGSLVAGVLLPLILLAIFLQEIFFEWIKCPPRLVAYAMVLAGVLFLACGGGGVGGRRGTVTSSPFPAAPPQ